MCPEGSIRRCCTTRAQPDSGTTACLSRIGLSLSLFFLSLNYKQVNIRAKRRRVFQVLRKYTLSMRLTMPTPIFAWLVFFVRSLVGALFSLLGHCAGAVSRLADRLIDRSD